MLVINKTPLPSGAYGSLQEWNDRRTVPESFAVWPNEFPTSLYKDAAGFVDLEFTSVNGIDVVVSVTPNMEKMATWRNEKKTVTEAHPDPMTDMAEMLVNLTYELELLKQKMGVV